jgi:hypothetical protein
MPKAKTIYSIDICEEKVPAVEKGYLWTLENEG